MITEPECRSEHLEESMMFVEDGAGRGVGFLNETRPAAGAGVRI